MLEYEIKSWNSIIPPGGTSPLPCIYIKPDTKFLEYAKVRNFTVSGVVKGTGSRYDKNAIVGVIDNSGYFPNFRPYFYNKTGYMVITLFCQWFGYPPNNGTLVINTGVQKVEAVPFVVPQPIEMYEAPKHTGLKGGQISIILGVILVLFLFLVLQTRR
jgi:hypothetical protein